jgi:hypothetical protein
MHKTLIWIASACLLILAIGFVSTFIWFKEGALRIKDLVADLESMQRRFREVYIAT